MAVGRRQRIRLGIFLVFGGGVLIIFFLLIAGSELFESRDTYYVEFSAGSVTGLQVGSQVRYNGIVVGAVEEIDFAEDSVERIVVTLSIRQDVPVKEDVRARMYPVGITGTRQINLVGGTDQADGLRPGSRIPESKSVLDSLTQLGEPAQNIVESIELLLSEENRDNVAAFLENAAGILDDNRGSIARIVRNTDQVIAGNRAGFEETLEDINLAAQNLETASLALSRALGGQGEADSLAELVAGLNRTVVQAESSLRNIEHMVIESERGLLDSISLLEETLEYLNNFAMLISDNPSRLVR
jgi:phospholipid/cholesterol/gamma-HCH transport system substrate-binding protein